MVSKALNIGNTVNILELLLPAAPEVVEGQPARDRWGSTQPAEAPHHPKPQPLCCEREIKMFHEIF